MLSSVRQRIEIALTADRLRNKRELVADLNTRSSRYMIYDPYDYARDARAERIQRHCIKEDSHKTQNSFDRQDKSELSDRPVFTRPKDNFGLLRLAAGFEQGYKARIEDELRCYEQQAPGWSTAVLCTAVHRIFIEHCSVDENVGMSTEPSSEAT